MVYSGDDERGDEEADEERAFGGDEEEDDDDEAAAVGAGADGFEESEFTVEKKERAERGGESRLMRSIFRWYSFRFLSYQKMTAQLAVADLKETREKKKTRIKHQH